MTALIKNMSEPWLWRPSGDSHIRMCHARVPHRELIDVSRETASLPRRRRPAGHLSGEGQQ